MDELTVILGNWIADPAGATIRPVGQGSGFSGAGLWLVECAGKRMALRRWPASAGSVDRLTAICGLQFHLSSTGLPIAAPLLANRRPPALVHVSDSPSGVATRWTLCDWLPGEADYWNDPQPAKLRAALDVLARIHSVAASYSAADAGHIARIDRSPALIVRGERLDHLHTGGLADLQNVVGQLPAEPPQSLAMETLALISRALNGLHQASLRWRAERLPLQWTLRDVWHDHVLFIGDRVTGVIDFGAAAIDSPAGDVARLLGSLVGDDRERRRMGLEAYHGRRPLSPLETEAIQFFDASGTLLAAFNWVHWLFREPTSLAADVDRSAAFSRLERLAGRLRLLDG